MQHNGTPMLLHFETLDDPKLVQAITTRHGGVSLAPHDQLNMSFSRPDDPEAVRENRRRVCQALEIAPERLVQAGQVHGSDVRIVEQEHAGRGALDHASVLPPADALITNQRDVYLLACFADCVPLLFFDPVRQAVGVAHAGWQGTVQHIAAETVAAMAQAFGSKPADLCVVVGPSAGPTRYNVWPRVAAAVREAFPFCPAVLQARDGETYFDLWTANQATLIESGVPPEQIEVSGVCTIQHADRFFSHRAAGGQTGRFAAVIGLRG